MTFGSQEGIQEADPPGRTEMGKRSGEIQRARPGWMDGVGFVWENWLGMVRGFCGKQKTPLPGGKQGSGKSLILRLSGSFEPGSASLRSMTGGGKHSNGGMGAFAPNDVTRRPLADRTRLNREAGFQAGAGGWVSHGAAFGNAFQI
ncbi:hypothetical protein llg_18270 [Luteolibacter sp. LG18]|nr:hypothetical protein llg_18270 [Luteolibacter sp. LG18]